MAMAPLAILLLIHLLAAGVTGGMARYARVFCFGDSLTDTGNAAIFPVTAGGPFTRPPYGETHFGCPSGRASDGRLINDFLVEGLKVPQPTPYLAGKTAADFLNGTNFALGGAMALDPAFLASRGVMITKMVSAGARTVVVTGMLPLGCEPQLLSLFPFPSGDHDPTTGCIARFNELAELHNRELKQMLGELRRAHPGRLFLYTDIYRPVIRAVESPASYGFGDKPLAACCGGGGGPYNFDLTAFCGTPGSAACTDPSEYVSWDGIHFTEAANRLMARAVLRGLRRGATVCLSARTDIPRASRLQNQVTA